MTAVPAQPASLPEAWREWVVHRTPGRVRLRVPGDQPLLGAGLAHRLRAASGVRDARWSAAARSLTVIHEPGCAFEELVEQLPPAGAARPRRQPPSRDAAPAPLWRQFLPPAVALGAGLAGALPLSAAVVGVCAAPIGRRALRSLSQRRLSIDVLDTTAISLLLGSGDVLAAGVSVALIESGERIRRHASGRARRVFRGWMDGGSRGVRLLRTGTEPRVPVDAVAVGDRCVIYAGETIPVDGTLVSGTGSVDTRTWTGEPFPVPVEPGAAVLAGSVVTDGRLVIEIAASGDETRAGRLAAAIEDAIAANTRTTDMARRIADRFVGPVLLTAGLVYAATRDVARMVSMLIVDFGTGIRIAVPTSILTTMITGARNDILFKSGQAIEELARVDTIVFDKTGTLTSGRPAVVGVTSANGLAADEVLRLAAAAEGHLPHPMARAIRRHARRRGLELPEPSDVRFQHGGGVMARVERRHVLVGRRLLLQQQGIALPAVIAPESSVALVAVDGMYAGAIRVADGLREEARALIDDLRIAGISSMWLATGDRQAVAARVARQLGLDAYRGQMMPEDKAELVRRLRRDGRVVAVVGDGINDAAAMAEADCGIAMSRGADLARQAADVVLAGEDLGLLDDAVHMARFAMSLVRQNIVLVAVPNAAALAVATAGGLTPLSATVVNNGSTLITAMNALRPLRYGARG